MGDVIASWGKRYINIAQKSNLLTDQQTVVRLTDQDQFTTDIKTGKHHLLADEPESFGGNGLWAFSV